MTYDFEILYVEDDMQVRQSVRQSLELAGFKVKAIESAEAAVEELTPGFPGIVVTDVRLEGESGLELLRKVNRMDAQIPVVLVTGHGDISMAVEAMRMGAHDFIEKPFETERFLKIVARALEKRTLPTEAKSARRQIAGKSTIDNRLLGNSPAMHVLREKVLKLAQTSADVLIVGETGTGKEMVARCLHDFSESPDANFVAINCGGLPETLFESEMFGHEAGAFTSAGRKRIGKLEHAKGGTLFLDEIESMQLALQVKLLRTLQERRIERLGSNSEIPINLRVVAATKVDLADLSKQERFRPDLYYRLSVAVIALPPLRERREDIPELFHHFISEAALRYHQNSPTIPDDVVLNLLTYDWPGNVRELRNVADRFVLGLGTGLAQEEADANLSAHTLTSHVELVERTLVERALRQAAGRVQVACDALGIGRKTLYDKINKHGISLDQFRVVDN